MLDAAYKATDVVVALSDPLQAFRLQNRQMVTNNKGRPIVGYTYDAQCWRSLSASTVIFLTGGDESVEFYRMLKSIKNAVVAPISASSALNNVSTGTWLAALRDRAVTWQASFAIWIDFMSYDVAAKSLRSLDLSPAECDDVLNHVNCGELRERMERFFKEQHATREVICGASTVHVRNGNWYTYSKQARKDVLVMDVAIELTKTISVPGADKYYVGKVTRRNVSKPFCLPFTEAGSKFKNWLEHFCLEHGLGCPYVASNWGPKIIETAKLFTSSLPNEPREKKVGWTKDCTSFMFPNKVVREGAVVTDVGIPIKGYPCQDVNSAGASAVIGQLLEHNEFNVQFWALFGCTLLNLAAPLYGIKRKKICTIGTINFAKLFAKALGLCTVQQRYMGTQPSHDVPTYVQLEGKFSKSISAVNDPLVTNILTNMTYLEAALGAQDDWVYVPTPDYGEACENAALASSLLLHAVKFVQTTEVKVKGFVINAVMSRFRDYLKKRFFKGRDVDFSVFDEAYKLVRYSSPFGTTASETLLYTMFMLMAEGKLSMSSGDSNADITAAGGNVTIHKSAIRKAIPDGRYAYGRKKLEVDGVLKKSTHMCWVIAQSTWDNSFSRFLKADVH